MAEEEKPEEVEDKDAAPAAESTEETPAAEAAPEEAPAVSEEAAPAAPAEGAPAEGAPAEEGAEDKKGKEKPRTAEDIFLELEGAEGAETPKVLKAKGSKNISVGIVHVSASFNNTIVTVADPKGDVIGWSSAGKMGFRGSRKSTAYASQLVAQDACRQAMSHGLKQAEVRVKGPGAGRESAVRAVQGLGIEVTSIKDVTPVPHNGCRPKKARRV
jgi:small subunit ribosomal protein S11